MKRSSHDELDGVLRDGSDPMGARLRSLAEARDPVDPAVARRHVAAAVAAVAPPARRRRRRRSLFGAAAAIGLLTGSGAMAAAGVAPAPVQRVAEVFGITADESPADRAAVPADESGESEPNPAPPSGVVIPGVPAGPTRGSMPGATVPEEPPVDEDDGPSVDGADASVTGPADSERHGRCLPHGDDCQPTFTSTPGMLSGGGTIRGSGERVQAAVRSLPDGTVRGTVSVTSAHGSRMRSTGVIAVAVDGASAVVEGFGDLDGVEVRFLLHVTDGDPDDISISWDGFAASGAVHRGNFTVSARDQAGSEDPEDGNDDVRSPERGDEPTGRPGTDGERDDPAADRRNDGQRRLGAPAEERRRPSSRSATTSR